MRSTLSKFISIAAIAGSLSLIPATAANASSPLSGMKLTSISQAQLRAALKPTVGARAVVVARQQVGKPYVYGAAGPRSFDCSGLTQYAYAKVGRKLPHNALQQYQTIRHVSLASLQVGDLVFMNFSGGAPSGITHVGIYAGAGNWYVAKNPGTTVALQHIWTHQGVYAGRP